MKNKRINRLQIIDKIKSIQGVKSFHQEAFLGKNIYLIGNDKNEPDFQIEFISQSKRYFYTILLRGLKSEADNMHKELNIFLKSLDLQRNIILDTETQQTLIK